MIDVSTEHVTLDLTGNSAALGDLRFKSHGLDMAIVVVDLDAYVLGGKRGGEDARQGTPLTLRMSAPDLRGFCEDALRALDEREDELIAAAHAPRPGRRHGG